MDLNWHLASCRVSESSSSFKKYLSLFYRACIFKTMLDMKIGNSERKKLFFSIHTETLWFYENTYLSTRLFSVLMQGSANQLLRPASYSLCSRANHLHKFFFKHVFFPSNSISMSLFLRQWLEDLWPYWSKCFNFNPMLATLKWKIITLCNTLFVRVTKWLNNGAVVLLSQ